MRRLIGLSVVVLVLGASVAAASPVRTEVEPSQQWQALLDEARRARAQNDWDAAHASFDRALAVAEASFGESDERLARTLEEIARAWSFQRNKSRAVELQSRAAELRLAMGPASTAAATAQSLNELGRIFEQFGDHEQAAGAFRQALELREGALGSDHPTVRDLRRDLSEAILAARPDDEEGAALLRRNLEFEDAPDDRRDLAMQFSKRGDHVAAAEELARAIALEEARPMPRPNELASLWTRLGDEYLSLGRHDDAERALLAALEVREDQLGPNHPSLAFTLKELAVLYIAAGRHVEAEAQLLRARELNEAAWGKGGHPCGCNTDALMQQVGEALGRETDSGREADTGTDAAASSREAKQADDPRQAELAELDKRAADLAARGEMDEAKTTAREALALREQIWGAGSVESAAGLGRLALLLRDERRYDEAAELWARRLTWLEGSLEPRDEALVEALGTMGLLSRMSLDYDDAEGYYRRELRARTDLGQNLKVARVLETLGNMNLLRSAPERAERDLAEAAERWEAMAGPEAPEIVRLRALLARAWNEQGRHDEAVAELSALLDIEGAKRHPDANLLWQVLMPLKSAHQSAGRADEARAVQARLDELRALQEAVRPGDERVREATSRSVR